MTMFKVALVVLGLAFVSYAQHNFRSQYGKGEDGQEELAKLLLALNPSNAFNPSVSSSVSGTGFGPKRTQNVAMGDPYELTPEEKKREQEEIAKYKINWDWIQSDPWSQDGEESPTLKYFKSIGKEALQAASDEMMRSKSNRLKDSEAGFDGGDSGGGVVGDGNFDTEDTHNSNREGGTRGTNVDEEAMEVSGMADPRYSGGGVYLAPEEYFGEERRVEPEYVAREQSAGDNYFGKSTGLAKYLIANMKEEDIKAHRIDAVRCQQLENWINQKEVHKRNQAKKFGGDLDAWAKWKAETSRDDYETTAGYFKSMKETAPENSVGYYGLRKHLDDLATVPVGRLDMEEWDEFSTEKAELVETIEFVARPGGTDVHDIEVFNPFSAYLPFQCGFVAGSSKAFVADVEGGTMERNGKTATKITIRYLPQGRSREPFEATFVFETEDFKQYWILKGDEVPFKKAA